MTEKIQVTFQVKDFHLDHIFDCGQCFRWNRQEDGSWAGIAGGRVARMQLERELPRKLPDADSSDTPAVRQLSIKFDSNATSAEGLLTIEGVPLPDETEEEFTRFWYEYLDLGRDYGRIKRSLGRGDKAMRQAIRAGEGIRILNQDLWETMVSFIISQNNNIPRIKGCIEALCREFGEPVHGIESECWYNIPQPEVLASLTRVDLEVCRLGYRAPYLIDTAKQVLERGGMDAVKAQLAQAEDVISALMDFAGVGPKVASCIALFGVGRADAFPIDVWMRRAMHTVYGIDEKNLKAMERYAAEHFGKYGGYAQQYLFYYIRGLAENR